MKFLSGFIFLLVLISGLARKNRKVHVLVASIAITSDVILILALTFGREVFADFHTKTSPLLWVHIGLALITLLFYFFLIPAGLRLLKEEDPRARRRMRRLGWSVEGIRFLVFLTSLGLGHF